MLLLDKYYAVMSCSVPSMLQTEVNHHFMMTISSVKKTVWSVYEIFVCKFCFPWASDYHTNKVKNKQAEKKSIQVNLCQNLLFLHQITHNMTKDCSLIYQFSAWKLQAQNMLCTYINCFLNVKTKNNFCTQHVLSL